MVLVSFVLRGRDARLSVCVRFCVGDLSRGWGGPGVAQYTSAEIPALQRIVNAEESRAATAEELKVLEDGLASPSAAIRVAAVRALGRLERPTVDGAVRHC